MIHFKKLLFPILIILGLVVWYVGLYSFVFIETDRQCVALDDGYGYVGPKVTWVFDQYCKKKINSNIIYLDLKKEQLQNLRDN